MEHLEGQLLPALRTIALSLHPSTGTVSRPLAHRARQTGATEGMNGSGAGEAVKERQGAFFLTATAFLLGGIFHSPSSKPRLMSPCNRRKLGNISSIKPLLNGHRFREIPRLIDTAAAKSGDVIG